jgi:hypothetical protein
MDETASSLYQFFVSFQSVEGLGAVEKRAHRGSALREFGGFQSYP